MNQENIIENTSEKPRLRSPQELFKETFRIFKWKMKTLLLLVFLPALILAVFVLLGFILFLIINNFPVIQNLLIIKILGIIFIIISLGVIIYSFLLASASMYYLIQNPNNTKLKDVLRNSKKYVWPLFSVSIINMLFVLLWGVLFIIPAFIFLIYYSFSKWAFALEGFHGTKALKRSRELVSGYWWQIIYRMSFFLIPSILFSILSELVGKSSPISYLVMLFGYSISIVLPIIGLIYNYLIFKDLQKIKPESKIKNKKSSKVIVIVLVIFGGLLLSIPILSTFSVVSLNNARTKSRDARRISDIKQIQVALELYHIDNGLYPDKLIPGLISNGNSTIYMSQIPKNPTPNSKACDENFEYEYMPSSDYSTYTLKYCLENSKNNLKSGINIATPDGI